MSNLKRELSRYIDKGGRDKSEIQRISFNCNLEHLKNYTMDYAMGVLTPDEMGKLMDELDSWKPH